MLHQPTYRLPRFGLALLLLISVEFAVVRSAAFAQHSALLSVAVIFDLTVITSGLFHWLVARPSGWSVGRTALVGLLMGRLALFMLPANALPPLLGGPALLALLEGVALLVTGFRLQKIRAVYRTIRPTMTPENALHGALEAIFGNKIAWLMVGEWIIVRYALLGWRRQPDGVPAGAIPITTHRQSGQVAVLVALGAVGLIELAGTHLLLSRWSADVAFWVTVLSAYGLLFLVAEITTTLNRPTYLTVDSLHLRLGVRWQAVIPRSHVAQLQRIHDKPAKGSATLNATLLTTPNVLLTLTEPTLIRGAYGMDRTVTQIALFVDEPAVVAHWLGA